MSGMKGSGSTTSTTTPNPQAMAKYHGLMRDIDKIRQTPYEAYPGELTAGINPEQQLGISDINQYGQFALPYIQQAAGMVRDASQPISASDIQRYMDPYTANVINATQADFANANAAQVQGIKGNAIAQGALGGNREAVAQAETAHQQALAQDPVIAQLRSQGYQTGLNTALTEQQQKMAAAGMYGNLGISGQGAALQGAGAKFGAGTAQQQTEQNRLNALYGQYMQKLGYPYEQLGWATGLMTGLGSQMGGTSTTTPPPPNPWTQMLGLGTAGLGMFGSGGYFGQPKTAWRGGGIAHRDDGGGIFESSWIPTSQMTMGPGPPKPPTAPSGGKSGSSGGLSGLGGALSGLGNLGGAAATAFGEAAPETAAMMVDALPFLLLHRGGGVAYRDDGGGVGALGVDRSAMPWAGAHGWIPSTNITRGAGAPKPPGGGAPGQPSVADQAKQIGQLASMLTGKPAAAPPMGIMPSAQGAFTPGPAGTMFPPMAPGAGSLEGLYARGGGIAGYDEGGTVRGPQGVGERFNDYMNSLGLPGSLDLADLEAHPVGVAAIGRAAFGSTPNDRVRRGFDMIERRTVHGYDDGGTVGDESFVPPSGVFGVDPSMFDPTSFYETPNPRDRLPIARDFSGGVSSGDEAGRKALLSAFQDKNRGDPRIYGDEEPPKLDDIAPAEKGVAVPVKSVHPSFGRPDARPDVEPETSEGGVQTVGYRPRGIAPIGRHLGYAPEGAGAGSEEPRHGIDLGSNSKLWPALMAAGLGMMASRSPYLGTGIGEGGLMGLQTYSNATQQEQQQKMKQAEIDLQGRKYSQALDREERKQRLEEEKLNRPHFTTDERGAPIMIDPRTGASRSIIPQDSAPVAPARQPQPALPPPERKIEANVKEEELPVHSVLIQDDNSQTAPSWVKPEVLEDMAPKDAALVRRISEGRQPFLPLSRNNKYNQYIMGKVGEYDDRADATLYGKRQRTANFFAVGTAGGGGQNLAAVNTWAQHASRLYELSKQLDQGGLTDLNAIKNWAADHGFTSKQTQDLLGAIDVDIKAVSAEGAKVMTGSNTAWSNIKEWQEAFGRDKSFSTMKSKLQEVAHLVDGRVNSLAQQYNEGMRTNHTPREFLAPVTEERMKLLRGETDVIPKTGGQRAAAPAGASPAASGIPPAPEREVGKVYQLPKGSFRWLGNGWGPP